MPEASSSSWKSFFYNAEIAPMADKTNMYDAADIKAWLVVIGHGDQEHPSFSGKTFLHSVVFAVGDGNGFWGRVAFHEE